MEALRLPRHWGIVSASRPNHYPLLTTHYSLRIQNAPERSRFESVSPRTSAGRRLLLSLAARAGPFVPVGARYGGIDEQAQNLTLFLRPQLRFSGDHGALHDFDRSVFYQVLGYNDG